ncbi:MAG: sn-glycerol-3-phosphate ABC transporter ATP-binding protein UgpC [Chloroflexi bacterium]|nr:sn-glycerol-3-phosphate ABC transporter ATP-binding protein UgpC [Chloroflexota bacterium]
MASVTYKNVVKRFGDVTAVNNMNFEVADKEFLVLVGPSGCGKTTALRLLAGLEEITSGEISIDGKVVNDVAPKDRDIAMVFQSYALYPHLSVFDNLAFGLKLRKTPKDEIKRRVDEAAKILGIEDLLNRKPRQLSGGQRQRVAVGRAIVREPKVFLFDEPLSNLDAKLRVQMRAEINKLHKRLQATFVYVTHDQVEAMTMASRIAVINKGIVQQIDTPQRLYDRPVNLFVAGFIGSPSMNFFPARLRKEGAKMYVDGDEFSISIPDKRAGVYESYAGKRVVLGIRPENIHNPDFVPPNTHTELVPAKIDVIELMGNEIFLHLVNGNDKFVARVDPRSTFSVGDTVKLAFDMNGFHIFDAETEQVIR